MTHSDPSRRVLTLTLVALALFALAPLRVTGWVRHLRVVPDFLIAPISHPVRLLANLIPSGNTPTQDSEELRTLRREIELERLRADQADDRARRLEQLLEEFKVMAELVRDQPVKQIPAPVYSTPSDLAGRLIRVRAGEREGVIPNTVAVASGLQLVGKVVEVQSRTCAVMPITAKGADKIKAVVLVAPADAADTRQPSRGTPAERLECVLDPVGNGTLRGPVTYRVDPAGSPIKAQVGNVVRLADDAWPRSAQFLTLGIVEAVDPSPSSLQRQIITVRPTIERLDRVKDVILRVPHAPADDTERGS